MFKTILLYVPFPLAMLIIFFLSKKMSLPPGIEDTGISRAFLKISLFIYRAVKKRSGIFSSDQVKVYLRTLERRKDMENAETEYFIRKISNVLLIVTAGCFLCLMLSISSRQGKYLSEGATIERNPFGESDFEAHLLASDTEGEEIGEFDVTVNTRKFTDKEAEGLFNKASESLVEAILGENTSLDEVKYDLDLMEVMDGYPFEISWKMDNYEVLHMDGKINKETMPLEGAVVTLTATFKYEELSWQQELIANIVPQALSPRERAERVIGDLIAKADRETGAEDKLKLPDNYEGTQIVWSERITDNSTVLFLLALLAAGAVFILKDKELKKAMEQRARQMLGDYPQMVSQMVLYMEAGMTMRNVFQKLSSIYERERKNGASIRYLYEEIQVTARELSLGTSEASAYEHFGIRCTGQQYARLCALLSQNLKKGNSELLKVLEEESRKAFEEKMDNVRKAGEEAGTKLLLPMVVMLVIVMVIIMIPAYMAF